mgnify:CR=1 FL=1
MTSSSTPRSTRRFFRLRSGVDGGRLDRAPPGELQRSEEPVDSSGSATYLGRYISMVVPSPTPLRAMTKPSFCSRMPYTVANPSPVPLPTSLMV